MNLKHNSNSLSSISGGLNNYIDTIDLNTGLLKKSLRYRKTEKIKNSLDVATKNYMVIYYKVNGVIPSEYDSKIKNSKKKVSSSKNTKSQSNIPNSFNKSKIKKLINENSNRIIKLRKKYYNNPSAIQKLSEISFLNSKLNSKFKNGAPINIADEVLEVKKKLDDFEKDIDNNSNSKNSKKSKNSVKIDKYKSKSIKKSKNISFYNNSNVSKSTFNQNKSKFKSVKKPKNDINNDILSDCIKTLKSKSNKQLSKFTIYLLLIASLSLIFKLI